MRFGFKILVLQFFLIYIMQVLSMLFESKTYLIVTNMYEGLYGGSLVIILYELSAEIAYPVGESLSLGFINALQFLIFQTLNFHEHKIAQVEDVEDLRR